MGTAQPYYKNPFNTGRINELLQLSILLEVLGGNCAFAASILALPRYKFRLALQRELELQPLLQPDQQEYLEYERV